jgi:UDP-glucose 4-epimerase
MSHSVLVTGGAGYIGSHCVAQLMDRGYRVTVLDNFSTGHRSLVPPGAQLVEGDCRDLQLVSEIFRKSSIESVIHFAAFTAVEESLREPSKYYSNNFGGTLNLLEACRESGGAVRNFIFSSTAAVYADPAGSLVAEDSPVNPVTPYGASKLMSEQALKDFSAASGLRYMNLRYFNVAGANPDLQRGQIGDEHTVLIKRAALAAVGKIPALSIFGTDYPTPDGTAVRDFIHVEDIADIHVLALDYLIGGGASETLNCGYGRGFSVRQVIETMKRVSGRDFLVEEAARRPGDLASVVSDHSKLLKTLSWQSRYADLDVICKTAFQWEEKLCAERIIR